MTGEDDKKAAMKKLRTERKKWIDSAAVTVKAQGKVLKAIRNRLAVEASTVPQISETVGIPTDQTLWYIAAMKKYGEVIETERDGSYYRYALVAKSKEPQDS